MMRGLLKKYKQETDSINQKLRNQLIIDYSPLIRFIAYRISARLPANVEVDDLMSAGVIGLMDAIDKYDPTRENKFKTYAEFRIRGAILDELRSQDWIPRSIRDKAKRVDRTYSKLEQEFGRSVSDSEMADELDVSLDNFYELLTKIKSVTLLSAEDILNQFNTSKTDDFEETQSTSQLNPYKNLSRKFIKRALVETIDNLPEKHRIVLSLYYYEDLNLKEIGKILEVTESRVSQLHTQAVEKLRSKIKSMMSE